MIEQPKLSGHIAHLRNEFFDALRQRRCLNLDSADLIELIHRLSVMTIMAECLEDIHNIAVKKTERLQRIDQITAVTIQVLDDISQKMRAADKPVRLVPAQQENVIPLRPNISNNNVTPPPGGSAA